MLSTLKTLTVSLSLSLLIGSPAFAQAFGATDTVWMTVCTALVLFMIPGLAFFYAGLVRRKNVLNTLMMSFITTGVVGLTWAFFGYSVAFGGSSPLFGDFRHAFLSNVGLASLRHNFPDLLFFMFQGAFAIVTTAIISGAVIERMRFLPYMIFAALWSLLVYAPLKHWIWGGGWLETFGVLDFAGGTVVHINAGISALVLALILGRRRDYGSPGIAPHSVPLTLLGAGILWFGWFGFNGGSALAAGNIATLAFVNTFLSPAVSLVVWASLDLFRAGKVTAVGLATAIVVGLVAITPGAGFMSPMFAIITGLVATIPSYYALLWRAGSTLDDSLDVFAAHGVTGITGMLLVGLFASSAWGTSNGLLFGDMGQFVRQTVGILATIIYSGVMTTAIVRVLGLLIPLRIEDEYEARGLDIAVHGEEAYIG